MRSPPPKARRKEPIKLGDSPIAEKRKREEQRARADYLEDDLASALMRR